ASACAASVCKPSCRSCRASASTSSRGMPIRRLSSSTRLLPPKSPRWCWTRRPMASQLTGWQIDILTEQEESERRQKEFAERTQLFMESLDVDETVAQLLASEGFASVEDVAYVEVHDLAEIEGFDEETAEELQTRALSYIEQKKALFDAKRRELGVEDEVAEVEGLSPAMLVRLGENG